MKNIAKKSVFIFLNFALIFCVSCFNAERNNEYDPGNPNRSYSQSCGTVCAHLWTVLTDGNRICEFQGDAFPCEENYEKFTSGCLSSCSYGDEFNQAWTDSEISCMYNAYDTATFEGCFGAGAQQQPMGGVTISPNDHNFQAHSSGYPTTDFTIQNDFSYSISINSITSNNETAFGISGDPIPPTSVGASSSEDFTVIFMVQDLSPNDYFAQINVNYDESDGPTDQNVGASVTGSVASP